MKLQRISVGAEALRLLRQAQGPRESYGDVVRRVFAETSEVGIDEYLADLRPNPPKVDVALLRRRRKNPLRSPRPVRPSRAV